MRKKETDMTFLFVAFNVEFALGFLLCTVVGIFFLKSPRYFSMLMTLATSPLWPRLFAEPVYHSCVGKGGRKKREDEG